MVIMIGYSWGLQWYLNAIVSRSRSEFCIEILFLFPISEREISQFVAHNNAALPSRTLTS